jgi:hypothetical protein
MRNLFISLASLKFYEKVLIFGLIFSVFSLGFWFGASNPIGFMFLVICPGPFVIFGLAGLFAILSDR